MNGVFVEEDYIRYPITKDIETQIPETVAATIFQEKKSGSVLIIHDESKTKNYEVYWFGNFDNKEMLDRSRVALRKAMVHKRKWTHLVLQDLDWMKELNHIRMRNDTREFTKKVDGAVDIDNLRLHGHTSMEQSFYDYLTK